MWTPIPGHDLQRLDLVCELQLRDAGRALEMLNFMYTNKEIQNLLAWGIEGRGLPGHQRRGASGVIDYMEGQDSGTVNYYQWTKYSFPNNFLQYVMKGTNPTSGEEMDEMEQIRGYLPGHGLQL